MTAATPSILGREAELARTELFLEAVGTGFSAFCVFGTSARA